ncbi:MAG: Rid family detoxifying hydrolase [Planctomycetota bacterium]
MRSTVNSPDAPTALGPYSQAVIQGGLLWCSMQLGLDPASGEAVGVDDVAAQAEQALRNLDAICHDADTALNNALRCTIYCTDLSAFAAINAVYATWFEEPFPARCCIGVAALPKGALVAIDAVVELRG